MAGFYATSCSDADSSPSQEEFVTIMQEGYNDFAQSARAEVSSCLEEVKSLEPLPTFTNGIREKEFMLGMTQNQAHVKLTKAADRLSAALGQLEADCKVMCIKTTDVVPEFEFAKSEIKRWLGLSCTLTCLKILGSNAAQSLPMGLLKHIDATLDFEAANDLQLCSSLKKRMSELSGKIKKASRKDQWALLRVFRTVSV